VARILIIVAAAVIGDLLIALLLGSFLHFSSEPDGAVEKAVSPFQGSLAQTVPAGQDIPATHRS
jgi:hypothetical protein